MFYTTRGIVLQAIKYSETSVIVKIYTEKLGLQSYLVKGVRSIKSKSKAAMLQPLTLLQMEVSHRENKQLQYIKEFSRSFIYQSIPFDTLKSTISFFLLEVISKSIQEHEPNEDLFEFIYHSLCHLDEQEELNPDYHLLFMVNLARHLGFAPHENYTDTNCFFEMSEGFFTSKPSTFNTMNKEESNLLRQLLNANMFASKAIKILRTERKKMLQNLIKYYQLHLENFNLRSPEILEVILE